MIYLENHSFLEESHGPLGGQCASQSINVGISLFGSLRSFSAFKKGRAQGASIKGGKRISKCLRTREGHKPPSESVLGQKPQIELTFVRAKISLMQ